MSKKAPEKAAAAVVEEGVSGQELKDIFFGFYGPEKEYEELLEEHYELTHYHQIKAEREKEIIAERRRKRQALVEARRLAEELRRIKELRDNPENLFLCAAKIQKYVRRNLVLQQYTKARQSLAEKPNKAALVIIGNSFEDRRVRGDVQAISDAFDMAKQLLCLGFQVDLLCDVPPYEEFLTLVDEPLAQADTSGRATSSLSTSVPPGGEGSTSPGAGRTNASGGGAAAALAATINALGNSSLFRSVKPPTRANIVAALETAATQTPSDTLLWVHVVSAGGRAVVNGKNPSRLAAESAVRTPRTRLIDALQHSADHQRSTTTTATGNASAVAASDTCHFIFPSDGRSARLTFDNIVRVEEVLDILSPRHAETVYGHPLHQRIVSIDVAPIGCVEGALGGGFACFASTCTATRFWELPPKEVSTSWIHANIDGPTRGCILGEPYTGLLTHALQQCLLGHCWCRVESTPRLYCGHVASYLDRWMAIHSGVAGEIRGVKGWGDFPVLDGDKLGGQIKYMERVYGISTVAQSSLTVGGGGGGGPTTMGGGAAGASQRKSLLRSGNLPSASAATSKGVLFEATMRFDITEDRNGVAGIDVFDAEFPALFQQMLFFFAQADPRAWAQNRQLRTPLLRSAPSKSIVIGLNTTFVDVSARMKAKGADPEAVWAELTLDLTGLASPPHYAVNVGKGHEGGGIVLVIQLQRADVYDRILRRLHRIPEVIPGVTHNALLVDVRCEVFATMAVLEQLTARARQVGFMPSPLGLIVPLGASVSSGQTTPAAGATPRADTNLEPPRAPTFTTAPSPSPTAMAEEDPKSSTTNNSKHSGSKAAKPNSANGFSRSGATASAPIKAPRRVAAADRGLTQLTEGQYLVMLSQLHDAVTTGMAFNPLAQLSAPTPQLAHAWGEFMDNCTQQLGNRAHKIVRVIKHKLQAMRVMAVRPLVMRMNELDDEGFALMGKRDRPPTPLASHAGLALCVVAMYNPTGEARCRQALHIQRVAQAMEVIAGIRFMVWDVANESFGVGGAERGGGGGTRGGAGLLLAAATAGGGGPLGASATLGANTSNQHLPLDGSTSHGGGGAAAAAAAAAAHRQTVVRFLDAVKLNIGTNAAAYPALMLWDMTKKRYYRLKALPPGASTGGGGGALTAMLAAAAANKSPAPFVTSLAPQGSMRVPPASSSNAMETSRLGKDAASMVLTARSSVFEPTAGAADGAASNVSGRDSLMNSARPPHGGTALPSVTGPGVSSSAPAVAATQHHHGNAHLIYPAPAIAHLCDEFLRGSLGDLLPPVKGSKVIGGGHSTTKYALISL